MSVTLLEIVCRRRRLHAQCSKCEFGGRRARRRSRASLSPGEGVVERGGRWAAERRQRRRELGVGLHKVGHCSVTRNTSPTWPIPALTPPTPRRSPTRGTRPSRPRRCFGPSVRPSGRAVLAPGAGSRQHGCRRAEAPRRSTTTRLAASEL